MKSLFNGNLNQLVEVIAELPVMDHLVSFAGEKTLSDIVTKLNNGCDDLSKQYNALPCEVLKVAAPSYQMENEGLFFDVATFLNGTPECWLNESYDSGNKPVKDLYINATFAASVSQKTIFEKLIQVVQIIDSLEGNGQRLNIFVCCYAVATENRKKQNLEMICKVKDCSERVNLDQLIYLCASPAMLRYCFLRLQYKAYDEKFVSSVTDTAADDRMLKNENIIFIPSLTTDQERFGIYDYKTTDLKTAYKIN